jgi:hypothetical protein
MSDDARKFYPAAARVASTSIDSGGEASAHLKFAPDSVVTSCDTPLENGISLNEPDPKATDAGHEGPSIPADESGREEAHAKAQGEVAVALENASSSNEPAAKTNDEEDAYPDGWYARFKQRVNARRNALLDTAIAFLGRRKKNVQAGTDALGDRPRDERSMEPALAVAEVPTHGRRNLLIVIALLVATAVGSASLSYQLLSNLLDEQPEKISLQQDQIGAFNEADQKKAAHIAELMKKLEDEQSKRVAAEEKNAAFEVQVMELKARASGSSMPPNPSFNEWTDMPSTPAQRPSTATSGSGSRKAVSNCNLKSDDYGETLKRCIENFNRN